MCWGPEAETALRGLSHGEVPAGRLAAAGWPCEVMRLAHPCAACHGLPDPHPGGAAATLTYSNAPFSARALSGSPAREAEAQGFLPEKHPHKKRPPASAEGDKDIYLS